MRLERARAVVGLTANNELNIHFAGEARDQFGVRDGYVAVNPWSGEVTSRIVRKQESRVLFDGPKDVERWHVRLRHGDVEVREHLRLELAETPEAEGEALFGAVVVGQVDASEPEAVLRLDLVVVVGREPVVVPEEDAGEGAALAVCAGRG